MFRSHVLFVHFEKNLPVLECCVDLNLTKTKKSLLTKAFSDRAGARTQDPLLKREMLYQLSYQVVCKKEENLW
jgi:hypothetical protein